MKNNDFTLSENSRSLFISNGLIGFEFQKPSFGLRGISNALSGGSFSRRKKGLRARLSIYEPLMQEARGEKEKVVIAKPTTPTFKISDIIPSREVVILQVTAE